MKPAFAFLQHSKTKLFAHSWNDAIFIFFFYFIIPHKILCFQKNKVEGTHWKYFGCESKASGGGCQFILTVILTDLNNLLTVNKR